MIDEPCMDPAERDSHAMPETQAGEIRTGTWRLLSVEGKQEELKMRRLKDAKENFEVRMKDVDQLREAELRDSDVQTQAALECMKAELLNDVYRRISDAKLDGGLVSTKRAASGVAPDSRDGDKDGTNLMRSEKGARLMPTRSLEGITGPASGVAPDSGYGGKDGGNPIPVRKRARLMPTRSFEEISVRPSSSRSMRDV